MNDQTQTFIRAILKMGGGALMSKGITDGATWEIISAGIIAGFGLLLGYLKSQKTEALKQV